ncbi:MAG: 2-oxo acid dehydrogenase subunit E2 [Bacilli bacterium]|nr:2-oxo acid dehydrogenase subunit E2 [Bacilli bacterium]
MRVNSKRIKMTGMEQIMVDLKPRRCDADVFINTGVDVTNLMKYLDDKKQEGHKYTFFHAIVLAFAKTIYNRPKLNRYISNRHMFMHTDVVIAFVAKVAFEDNAKELMIQVPISEDETIESLSKKIKNMVEKVRVSHEKEKGANSAIEILGKLPNIIRIPVMGLLKFMDKKGLLPLSLQEDDLYFSSAIVTNIGSLKSDSIYHNNTDFGTCSSITSIGEVRDTIKIIDGKEKIIKSCNFGINFDERIADGFYLIKSFKLFEYILNNPKMLEEKASQKIEME